MDWTDWPHQIICTHEKNIYSLDSQATMWPLWQIFYVSNLNEKKRIECFISTSEYDRQHPECRHLITINICNDFTCLLARRFVFAIVKEYQTVEWICLSCFLPFFIFMFQRISFICLFADDDWNKTNYKIHLTNDHLFIHLRKIQYW